jgi:PAS domain S-box-containing protein
MVTHATMNADAKWPSQNPLIPEVSRPKEGDASRILIIDDTPAIHEDFRKILARTQQSGLEKSGAELFGREASLDDPVGFELDSAYQGNEGLAVLQRVVQAGRRYALAFVDVRMPPGWDGIETTAQLWAVDPDLQIVICTAYSDQSWHAIKKRLGHRDNFVILKKPFDPIEILQLAHALTKKWLLTQQNKSRLNELESKVAERTAELRDANQKLIREIAESRRTQERMNLLFSALSAAANAIVTTDRNGNIEWVNPAFTQLTGYSADEIVGGNLRLLKSGQHLPAFYAHLWSTISTGNIWHGELVNKRKDGRLYTEEMTITPVRGADGQIAHFVAIKQDITEQRQLEIRSQQTQKMEAIGTLAGGIAHDFNNILAAIFGYGNLLQQDMEGNASALDDVGEILKAANRAKDLVQQILTFSHKREQKRQIIRLDTVVTDALKFLRASLPADIKIENHLAADAPAILADPTQIYQMVLNLATNAQHAMKGGSGRLTVRVESFLPDGKFIQLHPEFRRVQYARLTVADTGHGMDANTLKRIFEPFFTTKPAGQGTGLGLAVVHGLVHAHEGAITVESQPGQGSTFCLYFPAKSPGGMIAGAAAGKLFRGGGETILIVDDEPALTATFQRLLSRLNYQVVTSNSACAALKLFDEDPARFALVITDLTMPDMNGLELARQLRAVRQNVPVILTSGYAPELNRQNLQTAGVCELLEKPVSMPQLVAAVQRALSPNPVVEPEPPMGT